MSDGGRAWLTKREALDRGEGEAAAVNGEAKERTSEENASGSVDMAVEPMERVKARLTELSERLTGNTTVSKPGAR